MLISRIPDTAILFCICLSRVASTDADPCDEDSGCIGLKDTASLLQSSYEAILTQQLHSSDSSLVVRADLLVERLGNDWGTKPAGPVKDDGVEPPITYRTTMLTLGLFFGILILFFGAVAIIMTMTKKTAVLKKLGEKALTAKEEAKKEDAVESSQSSLEQKEQESDSAKLAELDHPPWAVVTVYQLVYSMLNASMGLFVLPLEAERMYGSNASLWAGVYIALNGISQLICPMAGKMSDHHCSRFGRRRPFLVLGTVTCVLGLGGMKVASEMLWAGLYVVSLFVAVLGLNLGYSAHCGLPADLQGIDPDAKDNLENEGANGVISGWMSLHSFLGSLTAMSVVVLTRDLPVQVQYTIYMAAMTIACVVVCATVHEKDTSHLPSRDFSMSDVSGSFYLDMEKGRDFFWVCAGRMFFYGAISSSVFMYYFLHDMIIPGANDSTIRSYIAALVLVSQLIGAVCSIPCGHLSNKIGRKVSVYAANALMMICFTLYMVGPQWPSIAWPLVLAGSIFYGVGAGMFLSVDYAIALECLPPGKSSAEAFGLWGVAGLFGSTLGPLIGGVMLWLPVANKGHIHAYPYVGYLLNLISIGPIMNIVGAYFVSRIRGLKEDKEEMEALDAKEDTQPLLAPDAEENRQTTPKDKDVANSQDADVADDQARDAVPVAAG